MRYECVRAAQTQTTSKNFKESKLNKNYGFKLDFIHLIINIYYVYSYGWCVLFFSVPQSQCGMAFDRWTRVCVYVCFGVVVVMCLFICSIYLNLNLSIAHTHTLYINQLPRRRPFFILF